MSNLQHGTHRFGYDPTSGNLYDYKAARYIASDGVLVEGNRVWDLAKVRELILAHQSIDQAVFPVPATVPADSDGEDDEEELNVD